MKTLLNVVIRKQWYESRRASAEEKVEKAEKKAYSDVEFKEATQKVNKLSIKLAFAELTNKSDEAREIAEELEKWKNRQKKALERLNMSFDDFIPKYRCQKCNDTGFAGHVLCDCFNLSLQGGKSLRSG